MVNTYKLTSKQRIKKLGYMNGRNKLEHSQSTVITDKQKSGNAQEPDVMVAKGTHILWRLPLYNWSSQQA
jgi:hypothetical protein